jgi:hypothetical protein
LAGGKKGQRLDWRDGFLAGVRSPPLRGEANPNVGRPAGKPGDDAKGGLLGGAHSVCPRCKAALKPRDHIIIGGKERPVA